MPRLSRLDKGVLLVALGALAAVALLQLTATDDFGARGAVAYLAPANGQVTNIMLTDPDNPSHTRQITFSDEGIHSFGVSPDGRWLVYSEYQNAARDTRLFLRNLLSGQSQLLTECHDSLCEMPTFSPDMRYIAYERITLNLDLPGVPASRERVWLVDLEERSERPLEINNTQRLSRDAIWSPDGQYVAVFDRSVNGVRIYDTFNRSFFIGESYGTSGAFTADGLELIYPAWHEEPGQTPTISLQSLNLSSFTTRPLTTDIEGFRPILLSFSPDNRWLAGLHLLPETQCPSARALYLARVVDADTLETITYADHCATRIAWDATGERLLLQKVVTDRNGYALTALWQYRTDEHTLSPIVDNAYQPHWLPAPR